MTLFPVGLLLITLFCASFIRGQKVAYCFALAFLPLGALAIVKFGNFNVLALHAALLILLGGSVLYWLFRTGSRLVPRIEISVFLLAALTVYAVMSSQIFPRVFSGSVMVFSLQSNLDGFQISPLLLSQITQLRPSSGNLSQPVYFLLSALTFMFTLRLARREGEKVINKAIYVIASVNALMGLLDFLNFDGLLTALKTAEYSIFVGAQIAGVARIVGAFPEASAMGSLSAALFAYMLTRYLDARSLWALALACINFLWALLALSSTGFAVLGFASVFMFIRYFSLSFIKPIPRGRGYRMLLMILLILSFSILLLLFTNISQSIGVYLDELIFNKSTSLSGLERKAWSDRGYALALETYGLGAGLGSTRSNGLLAVLVSNIGIFGVALYIAFLLSIFGFSVERTIRKSENLIYNAATAGLVAVLAGALVSGTTADPGILFMVFSALAVSSYPPRYIQWRKR